jgi:transcriptional regulator with XRE-family HTH domain
MSLFGERLRKLRDASGLTQKALGELVSLDRSAIANYETGRRQATVERGLALALALGSSMDYLSGGDWVERPLADMLPPDVPPDVRDWIATQGSVHYLVVAREMAEAGIGPEALIAIVDALTADILRSRPQTHEDTANHGGTAAAAIHTQPTTPARRRGSGRPANHPNRGKRSN